MAERQIQIITTTPSPTITDLGYANSWPAGQVPAVILSCQDKKHQREIHTIGNCLTQYTCKECNYTYKIDSGD